MNPGSLGLNRLEADTSRNDTIYSVASLVESHDSGKIVGILNWSLFFGSNLYSKSLFNATTFDCILLHLKIVYLIDSLDIPRTINIQDTSQCVESMISREMQELPVQAKALSLKRAEPGNINISMSAL